MSWFIPFRIRLICAACAFAFASTNSLPIDRLQAFDSFETANRSWQVRDHDGPIRVLRHQRVFDEAHSGSASEFVEFEAEQGTYVHLSHSISPSLIHPELTPQLWVKAERPGARLAVRVVLPHSKDPRTGQPTSLLVLGNAYALTGQWQQLMVTDIPTLLQRQLRALRAQTQQAWDDREAFIDLVVVNAYQGPRLNRLWLDDLDVRGHVQSQTPALAQAFRSQRIDVEIRGDTVLIGGAPRFLRMARYRGEPLSVFRKLGFNAIYTDLPANAALLVEAQASNLWVVAAPTQENLGPAADQLVAWTTGPLVGDQMSQVAAQRARQARLANPSRFVQETRGIEAGPASDPRPVIGDFHRIDKEASRHVDILLTGEVTRNNSMDPARYHAWLSRQTTSGRLKVPLWARIELDPSPTWRRQLELLGMGNTQQLAPSWQQLRFDAYVALTAGARGVLIDTRSPLVAAPNDTRGSLAYLLNAELAALEPWFAGGSFTRLHSADDAIKVTQLTTPRSRMLVALRFAPNQQLVEAPPSPQLLSIVSPPVAGAARGFRVSRGQLESFLSRRVPGGDQVSIDAPETIEAVVLSQDPLVLNHLSQWLNNNAEERAARVRTLAYHQLGLTAETVRRLDEGGGVDQQPLQSARDKLLAIERQSHPTPPSTIKQTREVMFELSRIARSNWAQQVTGLNPMSSPALLCFASLPLHQSLRNRLQSSDWSGNILGGANLENRESVERAGWVNHRPQLPEQWHTDVSFIEAGAKAGRGCLRIACSSLSPNRDYPSTSPVVIHSPPIQMRLGQVARISGWIKAPQKFTGLDGLMIHDSLGGRDLGLRFHHARDWTRFEFYRVAWAPGPLVVTWELTEAGEAWIDEVSVEVQGSTAPVAVAGGNGR